MLQLSSEKSCFPWEASCSIVGIAFIHQHLAPVALLSSSQVFLSLGGLMSGSDSESSFEEVGSPSVAASASVPVAKSKSAPGRQSANTHGVVAKAAAELQERVGDQPPKVHATTTHIFPPRPSSKGKRYYVHRLSLIHI